MISAGRVLLMPKGAYNPSTTYEMLDIVSYNGSSYIAKGTTTGNLPTDTTYWQLSAYGGQAANVAGNFAELEISSVASMTHYADDIFVDENSQLMKATQTINIGDTIDVNTNCTPTTVEALITSLSDRVDSLDSTNRKLQGAIEIAAQTDLHSLALGEYYKSQTSFYVTNAPVGINQVTSAKFRLTVEAALDNASQASSPLLLTLRTPDGKIFIQGYNGSAWSTWEQSAAKSAVDTLSSEIQTLTNQVKDMNNVLGSKNLLILTSYSKGETVSLNGGTIKCNDDGSYTINGTFTSDATLKIDWLVRADRREISNLAGKILTASCNGYNTSDIQFYTGCFKTDGTAAQAGSGAYEGIPRQYTMPSDAYTFRNWISIAAGSYSNVTIYPMVCLASVYELSPDWQSPSETNQQLTQDTTALLDNLEVNGAVNMLPNNATTQTVNGITFTVNDDGSVTANGTSTGYTSLVIAQHGQASFFDDFIGKPIKLSGCPSGGASNTYKLRFDYASGNYVDDVGEGVIITPTAGNSNTWYVEIGISGGVTVSNRTFKPMLTIPSYNGDYVPYAMTNRELTEKKLSLSVLKSVVADSSDFADFKTKIAAL